MAMSSLRMCRSEAQMPAYATLMRTSPGPGCGSGTSRTSTKPFPF